MCGLMTRLVTIAVLRSVHGSVLSWTLVIGPSGTGRVEDLEETLMTALSCSNFLTQAAMFSSSVQPGLVSLFSSTGTEPLSLFGSQTDTSLPSDSFICLLNDSSSQPAPSAPQLLITANVPDEDDTHASPNHTLYQTVLHIQSPTVQTTYIRCPPKRSSNATRGRNGRHLGLKHPWLHLQVRNMGREWAFEVGLVDQSGREGVVRCSTFQVRYRSSVFCTTTHFLLCHNRACLPMFSVNYAHFRFEFDPVARVRCLPMIVWPCWRLCLTVSVLCGRHRCQA